MLKCTKHIYKIYLFVFFCKNCDWHGQYQSCSRRTKAIFSQIKVDEGTSLPILRFRFAFSVWSLTSFSVQRYSVSELRYWNEILNSQWLALNFLFLVLYSWGTKNAGHVLLLLLSLEEIKKMDFSILKAAMN